MSIEQMILILKVTAMQNARQLEIFSGVPEKVNVWVMTSSHHAEATLSLVPFI